MTQPTDTPLIEIGTRFRQDGRRFARICTVVDILKTYNHKGELVTIRYLAEHEIMGQMVRDNVCAVTVLKNKVEA